MSISLVIYFCTVVKQSKEVPELLGAGKLSKLQIILSILLLVLCILINTISLLRIARRSFRLRHDVMDHRSVNNDSNSGINEVRSLIDNDEDDNDDEEVNRPFTPKGSFLSLFLFNFLLNSNLTETKPLEGDSQLFRHAILIALLTIDAVIVSVFNRNMKHLIY